MLLNPKFYLLALIVCFIGCAEFEPPVDCSDECGSDCDTQVGFDYETYESTCDNDEASTVFCSGTITEDCTPVDFDIKEATIADIHDGLMNRDFSCEWLIERYHEHIFHTDLRTAENQPPINAFVALNEFALETARKLDDYQRCENELSGPLHCVPFVIKTNYGSTEVPTTNGSWSLQEAQPDFDAFVVKKLRQAGALVLGSTTMDEFASGIHGISGRSGKTGNAFNSRYNSGGSSAGSGAAVGANMAVAGLGTDNCSSLTIPAAYNGLFTIRSSFQQVSTQGIFPSNRNDMVAGPMTRTVADLARFFDIMSVKNPNDHFHCSDDYQPIESMEDTALNIDGLDGKRIGIIREFSEHTNDWDRYPFDGANEHIRTKYDEFFARLEALGTEIVDDITLPDFNGNRHGSGKGVDVDRYLENTSGGVHSFEEICATGLYPAYIFADENACLSQARQTERQLQSNIERAREAYSKNRHYVQKVMDDMNLDALLYPSDAFGTASISGSRANCILPSVTGLPTMSVHADHSSAGLPIGMLFTARMHDEATLFEIAYAYEQHHPIRRAPQLMEAHTPVDLTIEQFNELHALIGKRAFDEILKDGQKFDLKPNNFADIVLEVLRDENLDALINN